MTTSEVATAGPIGMKLEVVVLGVSDVDRAKAFYANFGWRLDADFATGDDFRVVQLTPHNSKASIIFGKGITAPKPGSVNSLILAVDDVEAARRDLIVRGVNVSGVFPRRGERTRQRPRPARPVLPFVCLVRGPGQGQLQLSA